MKATSVEAFYTDLEIVGNMAWRLVSGRFVWFIWSIWSVSSVEPVLLNQTNEIDQTDQMNQLMIEDDEGDQRVSASAFSQLGEIDGEGDFAFEAPQCRIGSRRRN